MDRAYTIAARLLPAAGWQLAALGGATALVAILLSAVPAVGDTSSIYLLAVALVAIRRGTREALVTAGFSFVLYNYLFVEPRFTLVVASRESVVTLLLLLFLGVVIGRLAGRQHDRAEEAARHAKVVASLAAVSRHLATAPSTREALGPILDELVSAASLTRAWIGLGIAPSQESVIADSRTDEERPSPRVYHTARLTRDQVEWIRVSEPAVPHARRPDVTRSRGPARPPESALFRVEVAAGDDAAGSLWFQLPGDDRRPKPAQDRMVLAVAEQIGQSLLRDRLAQQAMDAQIATRSDELKSALLDSVSHDLRTPLASIRAAAGNLADPDLHLRDAERREAARAIDHEATRLSRLVSGLLDMSRIRAGSLRAVAELVLIEDLVRGIVDRSRDRLAGRELKLDIRSGLLPVEVDPVLVDQVISNLVDNAITHTTRTAPIRVTIEGDAACTRVTVEDGGPGVAEDDLQRIFEPFVRGDQTDGSANGAGLGLAVSRGLAEAMGGHISAGTSDLGGLRVVLELPAADMTA